MAVICVKCPLCQQHQGVSKNGKAPKDIQRFLGNGCYHSYQLEYIYNGNKPDTHEKLCPRKVVEKRLPVEKNDVVRVMDEQWSFVGNKKNQRWLWYA